MKTRLRNFARRVSQVSPPFHLRHWKWWRLAILLAVDITVLAVTYWLAFLLRFDWSVPTPYPAVYLRTCLLVIAAHIPIFFWGGMYREVWRYANYHTAMNVGRATFLGCLVSLTLCYFFVASPLPPRSIFVIHAMLATLVLASSRFSWRAWVALQVSLRPQNKDRCLIYGAGSGGDMLARHILSNPNFPYSVAGFVDDDRNKTGRSIHGLSILGTGEDLGKICARREITTLLLAMPSASGKQIRDAVSRGQAIGLKPLIMPDMAGSLSRGVFQPRAVDTQDLLKRSPKSIDEAQVRRFFDRKTVLVTGAGGSIGSEICRQILGFKPKRLILLDCSEYNLYRIEQELEDQGLAGIELEAILGSTVNAVLMRKTFAKFRPSIVLHAAACKHVPIIEKNPLEGILNNVLGTKNVAEAAIEFGAERFILISTDKAVRPTSVMGATKRCCELLLQAMHENPRKTSCGFASVRFGNVLGSSGSVIPRFLQQIESGGPVTVTHPEMTRYFMLTSEAVGLVLQSCAMSKGGEIFVLNMGEPVRILEMAEQLIRLAGKEPGRDIEIAVTGIRPGEKLYEELLLEGSEKHTLHDDVFIATPLPLRSDVQDRIQAIIDLANEGKEELAVHQLRTLTLALRPPALISSALPERPFEKTLEPAP